MPLDIYAVEQNQTSTTFITASQMKMVVAGSPTTEEILLQSISITYSHPIQTLREIGSRNYYHFGQPPQGQLVVGRLISKNKKILDIFPQGNSSVWNSTQEGNFPDIHLLDFETGKLKLILRKCIATNLGITINAENNFCQEQVVLTFVGLEYY